MQIVPFMHRLSQVFTTTPRQGAIILRRSQVPVYVGTGGKRSQDITHHSPPHPQTIDRILHVAIQTHGPAPPTCVDPPHSQNLTPECANPATYMKIPMSPTTSQNSWSHCFTLGGKPRAPLKYQHVFAAASHIPPCVSTMQVAGMHLNNRTRCDSHHIA